MTGTAEKDKVETALSGVRSLVLGTQILLGFQYRAAFEPRFGLLPGTVQGLSVAALLLLVASFTCMVAPAPFHRIVAGGHARVRMHHYTNAMAAGALVPFALALGLNVAVALAATLGLGTAALLGAVSALAAGLCWFLPLLTRRGPAPPEKDEMTDLKERINELMTESRIILPGVQALLGFQFASYLMDGFNKLPGAAKVANTTSLFLLLVAMLLLMTPPPFQRLAERGENTERFERVAERLVLASLPLLALGVAGDVFVVVAAVGGVAPGAWAAAGCAAAMMGVWFGVPMAARRVG